MTSTHYLLCHQPLSVTPWKWRYTTLRNIWHILKLTAANNQVLPARRYSSAVSANKTLRPFVCHKPVLYRNAERIELIFLAQRLPSTYPKLRLNEIRVSPKIRVFPSGILSKLWSLKNFAVARSPSPSVVNNRPTTVTCLSQSTSRSM